MEERGTCDAAEVQPFGSRRRSSRHAISFAY
jgi:hypothetical protein